MAFSENVVAESAPRLASNFSFSESWVYASQVAAMIASRFRPVTRFMSTLALDQRQALQLPQRIEAMPKNTSKFRHAQRAALGIQFYGASSASEIVPMSPGERTLARELVRFHVQHVVRRCVRSFSKLLSRPCPPATCAVQNRK